MTHSNARDLLCHAAARLGPLRERVMFVGGATTWLHVTDPAARPSRQTKDVDIVVEVTDRAGYYRLGDEFRALGFVEDSREGAPICRWCADDLVVDLLPTDGDLLGFSNRWYRAAMDRAREHPLEHVGPIRVARATDFLAMKLEAFGDRGGGDYLASKDLEDIVSVIDGRPEIVAELAYADPAIQSYIREELRRLFDDTSFEEAIYGHFGGDPIEQARVPLTLGRLRMIAGLE